MRVLHLTTEFPPIIYGGLGTAVGGWVTGSARSGLDVAVLLVEGPLADEDGVLYGHPHPAAQAAGTVVERSGVTFFQASSTNAVDVGLEAVRRWQPNIIHLHTAMIWHVADAIRRQTGKPLVYHVHSVDRAEYELGHEPNQWLAQATEQTAAIISSDRLIALSESESERAPSRADRRRRRARGTRPLDVAATSRADASRLQRAMRRLKRQPTPGRPLAPLRLHRASRTRSRRARATSTAAN
jgi:Glycosyl transferase 4-like domain